MTSEFKSTRYAEVASAGRPHLRMGQQNDRENLDRDDHLEVRVEEGREERRQLLHVHFLPLVVKANEIVPKQFATELQSRVPGTRCSVAESLANPSYPTQGHATTHR